MGTSRNGGFICDGKSIPSTRAADSSALSQPWHLGMFLGCSTELLPVLSQVETASQGHKKKQINSQLLLQALHFLKYPLWDGSGVHGRSLVNLERRTGVKNQLSSWKKQILLSANPKESAAPWGWVCHLWMSQGQEREFTWKVPDPT